MFGFDGVCVRLNQASLNELNTSVNIFGEFAPHYDCSGVGECVCAWYQRWLCISIKCIRMCMYAF